MAAGAISRQLTKIFGQLNRGEINIADLSSDVLKEIDAAKELYRRGQLSERSYAFKFFKNEDLEFERRAEELIRRKEQQEQIRQRVEVNRREQQAVREARNANIYLNNRADIFEARGFDGGDVQQAINSIRRDKIDFQNLSNSELNSMIEDRIFQIRAERRFNNEVDRREQARLGERGRRKRMEQYIEEDRRSFETPGPSGSTTSSPAGGSSAGAGSAAESAQESAGKYNNVVNQYMANKYEGVIDDISQALNSGHRLNPDAISTFARQARLNDEVAEQFGSLVQAGKNNEAISLLKGQQSNYMASATMMDKAMAYKVPQRGAVVVGGAWLVQNMFSSRGQQTNAQLYGQQMPYY